MTRTATLSSFHSSLPVILSVRVPSPLDSRSRVCAFDLPPNSIAFELVSFVRVDSAAGNCDNDRYGVHRLIFELGLWLGGGWPAYA